MEDKLHAVETTRGEKVLATVLAIFLLIAGVWVLDQLDDIPSPHRFPAPPNAWTLYQLKQLLLQLGYTIPLFIIAIVLFFKARERKSPYLIHVNAFLAFSTSLFAIALIRNDWFWRDTVVFGLSLVGATLSAIALAYLKKSQFSFERIARSRARKNRCPWCEFPFPVAGESEYCRNCGNRVMKPCEECNALRYVYLLHCHHCGTMISG